MQLMELILYAAAHIDRDRGYSDGGEYKMMQRISLNRFSMTVLKTFEPQQSICRFS